MQPFARALLALTAVLPLACSAADEPRYQLGTHYKAVRSPQPTANPAKIEVAEVFAYSCPHCFQFEPHLDKWLAKKPSDVEFVRLPHTLGMPANQLRNKAFYAAQLMGVFEPFHRALFGAIHGQGKMMTTPEEMKGLFVQHTKVKAEDFDGAFNSFAADAGARRAEATVRELGVASVPALVVEGRYQVGPREAGGFPQMLSVADFLVEQARKERSSR